MTIPEDVVYLPADAVYDAPNDPPDDDRQEATPPTGSIDVCNNGELFDHAVVREGDTIESFAAAVGVSVADLNEDNGFDATMPDGRPMFGEFEPGVEAGFPCRQNWPAHVEFFVAPEGYVCAEDTSRAGRYTVQPGDTAEEVATRFGVTIEGLNEENASNPAYPELSAGSEVWLCSSWFE